MINLKSSKDWFVIEITDSKGYKGDLPINKDELEVLYKLIGRYIEKDKVSKKRKTKD